ERCQSSTCASTVSVIAAIIPGSRHLASGTRRGRDGSDRSCSTPIHSDCTSFRFGSRSNVFGAGCATSATSTFGAGWSTKRSCGSAFSSSGIQRDGGSLVEAKRIFTAFPMLAFAAKNGGAHGEPKFQRADIDSRGPAPHCEGAGCARQGSSRQSHTSFAWIRSRCEADAGGMVPGNPVPDGNRQVV